VGVIAAVHVCGHGADTALSACGRGANNALHACGRGANAALHACGHGVDRALGAFEAKVQAVILPVHANKKVVLAAASLCALIVILLSASSSSHIFYEYSVGGHVLGVVRDAKTVSRAVENSGSIVSREDDSKVSIPAENGSKIVIDKDEVVVAKKKIVAAAAPVHVDKGEDIIEKLTTLEGVDVVADTLTIDGRTFGPFESKEAAQSVLDRVREYWLKDQDVKRFKEIGFANEISFGTTTAPKESFVSPGAVYEDIMKVVFEYKDYIIKDGDTIFDIAMDHDLTVDKIEELNPDFNLEVIHTGDKLRLEEVKAVLSIRTAEEIEFDETYKAEPVYNDSNKLYVGEEIVTSEGHKGKRHVAADLIRINGKVSEKKVKETEILKKSVPAKILRGTKPLPPLIGKGYFIRPANAGVTSGFKYRWGRHHDGVDFGIRYGSVVAADGGNVVFAGNRGDGYGNKIIINHGGGRTTVYGHLSQIKVNAGEKVFQGQLIAISGNTGSSTGPHLHFEVRINGVAKNPMDYL
jgi:murein DD-endopeptidase MepM/ murein hydrolase activator NlpD